MKLSERITNNYLIPIYMLWFCLQAPLTTQNITYICNMPNFKIFGIILASIISIHYFNIFKHFFIKVNYYPIFIQIILIVFLITIPLVAIIPYNNNDILSKLHVFLAFGGSIAFLLLLNLFLWQLFKKNVVVYNIILPYYTFIISSCTILFLWYGSINSLIELVFIYSINIFIAKLKKIVW